MVTGHVVPSSVIVVFLCSYRCMPSRMNNCGHKVKSFTLTTKTFNTILSLLIRSGTCLTIMCMHSVMYFFGDLQEMVRERGTIQSILFCLK